MLGVLKMATSAKWQKFIKDNDWKYTTEFLINRYVKDGGFDLVSKELEVSKGRLNKCVSQYGKLNPDLFEKYKEEKRILGIKARYPGVTSKWIDLKRKYPDSLELAIYLMEEYVEGGTLEELSKQCGIKEIVIKNNYMSRFATDIFLKRPDLYEKYLEVKKEHNKISRSAMYAARKDKKKQPRLHKKVDVRPNKKLDDILNKVNGKIEYTALLDKVALCSSCDMSMKKVLEKAKTKGIQVYYKTESGLKLAN